MGMYTELVLAVQLKEDVTVLGILKGMLDAERQEEPDPKDLPDHPLFQTSRWWGMLLSDSCYFRGGNHSSIIDHCGGKSLVVRCDLKNYGSEIDHFLNWLTPYVDPDGLAGYCRYEENVMPTLIFFEPDGLHLHTPELPLELE